MTRDEIIKKSLRMQSTKFLLAECRRLKSMLRDNWLQRDWLGIRRDRRIVISVLLERRV